VLRQLDRAYDNWWDPRHPAGPPTFKKRHSRLAIPFPGQAVKVQKLNRKWGQAWLPKVGWVRFRLSRPLGGVVRNATISRDGLGWHISFGVATGARPARPNGLPGCGVDFGVACSAYVSDESSPRLLPPTLTAGEQRRLLGLERRMARQVRWAKRHNRGRYSRRLRRTIAEIGRLRARQARRRLDFTHKLTSDLAKSHGWVGIEDLRVRNMTRSAKGTILVPWPRYYGEGGAEPRHRRQRPIRATPAARLQDATLRLTVAAGSPGVHLPDVLGMRPPRSRVAPRMRAPIRLHRMRLPSPRRPQRRTQHRTDCRRAGGRQHAQSPPGGEAGTEPNA
jgi:transposase